MQVEQVSLPSFFVLGQMGRGPAGEGPRWIAPLWERANNRFDEIAHLAARDEQGNLTGLWGAMSDVEGNFLPWRGEGLYLAGCQAKADTLPPEGWTLWHIPAQRYLVVACTQQSYGEVFTAMLKEELPSRGRTLAGAVHERFHPGREGLELWFPIEREE